MWAERSYRRKSDWSGRFSHARSCEIGSHWELPSEYLPSIAGTSSGTSKVVRATEIISTQCESTSINFIPLAVGTIGLLSFPPSSSGVS